MGLGVLLDQIRNSYLKDMLAAIAKHRSEGDLQIEPEYLLASGELARSGDLNLPYRGDLIVTSNGEAINSLTVNSSRFLGFEPIIFQWEDKLTVKLSPFQWDCCQSVLSGIEPNPMWNLLQEWFENWFRGRPSTDDGFMHAVHFMSDPIPVSSGTAYELEIDFGTASVKAFEEFLDAIQGAGFTNIEISGCT